MKGPQDERTMVGDSVDNGDGVGDGDRVGAATTGAKNMTDPNVGEGYELVGLDESNEGADVAHSSGQIWMDSQWFSKGFKTPRESNNYLKSISFDSLEFPLIFRRKVKQDENRELFAVQAKSGFEYQYSEAEALLRAKALAESWNCKVTVFRAIASYERIEVNTTEVKETRL